MLYTDEDGSAYGPFLGAPGLNFTDLAATFRAERFAQAEAAQEDFCFIGDDDLVTWLLENGILARPPVEPISVTITVDTQGENRYVPRHWPVCPECQDGRGEDTSGDITRELNRWVWHYTCTACGHTWGHRAVPYDSKKPIIEDDGRMTHNGCVPYSISQTGGLPMEMVLAACRERGFSEEAGMYEDRGIEAACSLGLRVQRCNEVAAGKTGKPTLRRTLNALSPTKNYIVATRGHWLAVVQGENRDIADTGMRAEVIGLWEIQTPNKGGKHA